jgi:hypothetical protein
LSFVVYTRTVVKVKGIIPVFCILRNCCGMSVIDIFQQIIVGDSKIVLSQQLLFLNCSTIGSD